MDLKNDRAIGLIEGFFNQTEKTASKKISLQIEELLPKSLDVFKDILDNNEIGLDYKFKVAKYILELSPIGKELTQAKTPHFVTAMIRNFSETEISELKKNADAILKQWETDKNEME